MSTYYCFATLLTKKVWQANVQISMTRLSNVPDRVYRLDENVYKVFMESTPTAASAVDTPSTS